LSFLKSGQSYKVTSFEDGINAGYQAMDYRKKSYTIKNSDVIEVKMVRNGGWAAVLDEI
ncbi:MAG: alpha-glucosidase, partial [Bacteroidota bacterium]|nr:alpha-glucosidase [Bacteroidota bacterium]